MRPVTIAIAAALVLAASPSGVADVTRGLITRYSFEEGSGTTATDVSGHGHNATISGATWTTGGIGGGLQFDGTNDVVQDLSAGSYLNGLTAVTVCVWVESDVTRQDRGILFTRNPTGNDEELGLRYDADGWGGGAVSEIKASVRTVSDYTQVETVSNVQTTSWQFLTLVWQSGQSISLYIDARPVNLSYNEGPVSGAIAGVQKLMIGCDTKNMYWDGKMDDFRIYDRALSRAEIIQIYCLGLGGLLAHYELDEGAGQVAADSSGFGHHGRLGSTAGVDANDPTWASGKCAAALSFDGTNDYVRVPHSDDFLLDAGTISCWFFATSTAQPQGLVTKDSRDFDTGGQFGLYIQGNKLRVRLESINRSYELQSGNIAAGTWYHAAFTFGPDGMRLYLDGVEAASNPYTGGLGMSSGGSGNFQPLAIGVDTEQSGNLTISGWTRPYSGLIDDVRIYARALAPAEIAQVMQCNDPTTGYTVFKWREVRR